LWLHIWSLYTYQLRLYGYTDIKFIDMPMEVIQLQKYGVYRHANADSKVTEM
jgi:hypothetical protein